MKTLQQTLTAIALLLLPLALLALIYFVVYPKDFELQSFVGACQQPSAAANFVDPVTVKKDFRLLIGILTRADTYERRHLVRMVYSHQKSNLTAHVDVRFIFCNLTKEDQRTLISLEILQFNDIIILNCSENMNSGKTYTYFSSLPTLFSGDGAGEDDLPYDYVMKGDDDIYFHLPHLVDSLRHLPREDLYYGFVIPCDSMDPFRDYMAGMGYILSWDLVEWISTSETAKNEAVGTEDMLVGRWLDEGKKAKNRYNMKFKMYDYPITPPVTVCTHKLWPETIAVHRLKTNLQWARVLEYMNITKGLKPSKFYHMPSSLDGSV